VCDLTYALQLLLASQTLPTRRKGSLNTHKRGFICSCQISDMRANRFQIRISEASTHAALRSRVQPHRDKVDRPAIKRYPLMSLKQRGFYSESHNCPQIMIADRAAQVDSPVIEVGTEMLVIIFVAQYAG
jgi:hypothetical protein